MAYRPKPPSSKERKSSRAGNGTNHDQRTQFSRKPLKERKTVSASERKFEAKPEIIPKSKAAAVRAQEAKALEAQKRAARSKRWAEQRAGSAKSNHERSARGELPRRLSETPAPRDSRIKRPAQPDFTVPKGKEAKNARAGTNKQTSTASQRERDSKPAGMVAAKPTVPERIAKVIARAGVCSRRDAESFIAQGRVSLNGVIVDSPAVNVNARDDVRIDGDTLRQREKTRLFLFHKPRGLVTTDRDPEGRPTVFEHLRKTWIEGPRVMSIGRLDINTEGLLLLTNDGGLARVLELPSTGWTRRYRVRANGKTDQAALDSLRGGVTINGVDYAGIEAAMDRQQGANVWLTISLREGKNREVKRVLEHLGLFVNRLIRLSFGPFQLGELDEGAVSEVKTRVLTEQLGPVLSESAGAEFLNPLLEEIARDTKAALTEPALDPAKLSGKRAPVRDDHRAGKVRSKAARERQEPRRPAGTNERRQLEDRPKLIRPLPGPRKHISALREPVGDKDAPRSKITREMTTDRKGRTIAVERISHGSKDQNPVASTRNKNRFESEKTGSKPVFPFRQGKTQETKNRHKPDFTENQRLNAKPLASRVKPGGQRRKQESQRPRNILDANPG